MADMKATLAILLLAAATPVARELPPELVPLLERFLDLAKLDGDVFKAIHNDRVNLFDEKTILEWVTKKGVDPKKFSETFNSFGVMSKVKRGDQLAQAYKISGVPAIAVDGKYLVGGQSFGHVAAEPTGCSSNENRFAVVFHN